MGSPFTNVAAKRFSATLRELAALADFMHGDGREAFALLSESAQEELRDLFQVFSADLHCATDQEGRHV